MLSNLPCLFSVSVTLLSRMVLGDATMHDPAGICMKEIPSPYYLYVGGPDLNFEDQTVFSHDDPYCVLLQDGTKFLVSVKYYHESNSYDEDRHPEYGIEAFWAGSQSEKNPGLVILDRALPIHVLPNSAYRGHLFLGDLLVPQPDHLTFDLTLMVQLVDMLIGCTTERYLLKIDANAFASAVHLADLQDEVTNSDHNTLPPTSKLPPTYHNEPTANYELTAYVFYALVASALILLIITIGLAVKVYRAGRKRESELMQLNSMECDIIYATGNFDLRAGSEEYC